MEIRTSEKNGIVKFGGTMSLDELRSLLICLEHVAADTNPAHPDQENAQHMSFAIRQSTINGKGRSFL